MIMKQSKYIEVMKEVFKEAKKEVNRKKVEYKGK